MQGLYDIDIETLAVDKATMTYDFAKIKNQFAEKKPNWMIVSHASNVCDAETIAIGTSALRIICVGFIVSTISVVASGSLEGLGMGVQSLVISLCRYIVVIMPLAWLFCRLLGADGIWNAFWVTEVITAGISMVVYHKSVKLK